MATATPNSSTNAIEVNPLGWNNNFNMIFLEQPVGVGFSYSDDKRDYSMFNDTISAADNYAWLQAFMNAMPQYSTQPLWFAGESYGGAYIPQLSYAVLTGANTGLKAQLAGVLIGNPVLSCPDNFINIVGLVQADILFHHALVPQSARDDYVAQGCAELYPKDPSLCNTLYSDLLNLMGPINPDNEWSNEMNGGNGTLGLYVGAPAVDRDANWATYLNRADVQAAIGAKSPVFPPWNDCVMNNDWQYDATFPSSLPQYTALFQAGKQVLIYSGDVDVATCPFAGTQYCLNQMNRPVLSGWQSWNVQGQQAGYVQQYDVMTFATVKGGGHEAPGFQPLASYEMVNRFISTGNILGTTTPKSKATVTDNEETSSTDRAMNGRLAQSERLRMAMKRAIENGVNRQKNE